MRVEPRAAQPHQRLAQSNAQPEKILFGGCDLSSYQQILNTKGTPGAWHSTKSATINWVTRLLGLLALCLVAFLKLAKGGCTDFPTKVPSRPGLQVDISRDALNLCFTGIGHSRKASVCAKVRGVPLRGGVPRRLCCAWITRDAPRRALPQSKTLSQELAGPATQRSYFLIHGCEYDGDDHDGFFEDCFSAALLLADSRPSSSIH